MYRISSYAIYRTSIIYKNGQFDVDVEYSLKIIDRMDQYGTVWGNIVYTIVVLGKAKTRYSTCYLGHALNTVLYF